jgi:ubiquinone/menaquinone biosynthesis C-methylase UbiE
MSDKGVVIEAFSELAPRYEQVVDGELQRFWGWRYSTFIDKLLSMTPIHETQMILDVATGTAVIPRKIAERRIVGNQIIGLDITYQMLKKAKQKVQSEKNQNRIDLTCATALSMPFANNAFDLVTCGLATHHMNIPTLLSEMYRVLGDGGRLSMADVGGSPLWRLPLINGLIRILAFLYFLFAENFTRAWAEAGAVTNIYTAEQWKNQLQKTGFSGIEIIELPSSHSWTPSPLIIQAIKSIKRQPHDNS